MWLSGPADRVGLYGDNRCCRQRNALLVAMWLQLGRDKAGGLSQGLHIVPEFRVLRQSWLAKQVAQQQFTGSCEELSGSSIQAGVKFSLYFSLGRPPQSLFVWTTAAA